MMQEAHNKDQKLFFFFFFFKACVSVDQSLQSAYICVSLLF